MSALSDRNNVQLDDPAKKGPVEDDPRWRALMGLGEVPPKKRSRT